MADNTLARVVCFKVIAGCRYGNVGYDTENQYFIVSAYYYYNVEHASIDHTCITI